MKEAFIAAAVAEQVDGGVAEVCAVLNRLPAELLPEEDAEAIDLVDALMDDLYQRHQLFCPGHRWMTEPPASIRGHLVHLFEAGNISRDPAAKQWVWSKVTSYIHVPGTTRS